MKSLLLALTLLVTPGCGIFGGTTAFNLHGGLRDLDKNIDSVNEQQAYGGEVVLGVKDGWSLEGQYFFATEEKTSALGGQSKLESNEFALGLRHTFLRNLPVKLYLGGGANFVDAKLTNPNIPEQTDDGLGFYIHGGVTFAILMFNAGIDLRAISTDARLADERLDYGQATIFIGLTF
ncbi:MAG: outer membrane beta-barrel protein [Planctomycetota bacterium]